MPRRAYAAARRLGLDFRVLIARNRRVIEEWGAQLLPISYVLDARGTVHFAAPGPPEGDTAPVVKRLYARADEAGPRSAGASADGLRKFRGKPCAVRLNQFADSG